MKDFTFGIVTYNSERTIVETLESIKYQIEHYGKNMNFFLVLSDDCSTDKTLRVVKRWLAINSALFVDNVVLATSQNSGLCINYAQMIENIKTDYFIQIAGDDLISSCNVFKSMENLKKNEVRVYLPVYYDDKQIYVPKECIARQLFYRDRNHSNKIDLWLLETVNPTVSTEITFFRQHYSSECMKFMKRYKNFEDDPSLYYIMKNNSETKFTFKMEPFILYRQNGNSLTTSVDTNNQIRFLDDLHNFRKITFKYEKNIFVKIYLFFVVWSTFLMKHRFDASKTLSSKIENSINNRCIKAGMKRKGYEYHQKQILELMTEENKYVREIKENTTFFFNQEFSRL